MEFNTFVKMQFFPILQKYGFEIVEEFKNILRFQSSIMKVNIVFNEYDKSCFVEIGKLGEILYPLNDNVTKKLFNLSLSLEQVTPEVFVYNLSILFRTEKGVKILEGNVGLLKRIIDQQAKNYTSELIHEQVLESASKAWDANDYIMFVNIIDKIGINNVPYSYQLKYKIAKQKL